MRLSADLHIHSSLSPCASNDMTPNNIINMAYIKGLDVISVTDHNTMLNTRPLVELGGKKDILVVPGIEVTTKEEIHVLCYFVSLSKGLEFQNIIYEGLPQIKNNRDIFGAQYIMDSDDNCIGELEKLLISSTKYSIDEIYHLAQDYDGIMVPAHIDKKVFSLISVLGFIPDNLKINTLEISNNRDIDFVKRFIFNFNDYEIIVNSDAHFLEDISEAINYIYPKELNNRSIISYLKNGWRYD